MTRSRRLQRRVVVLLAALAALLGWVAQGRRLDPTLAGLAARLASGDPDGAENVPIPSGAASRRGSGGPTRDEMLEVMNAYRQRHGLRPLRLNPTLNAAADDRIRDMFGRKYFDHVAPDGTEPYVWARRRGYRYTLIGENLAMGHDDAREVVGEWMRSASHRANILGEFEDSGIAFARGSPTGPRAGYTFVVLYATGSFSNRRTRLAPAVRLAHAPSGPSDARAARALPATMAA